MFRSLLSKAQSADRLIAGLPLSAAKPAALIAEKFRLVFLKVRERGQKIPLPVQAKIRNDIPEFLPLRLLPEILKLRENLRRGRNQIQLRIVLPKVFRKKLRVDDDAVLHSLFSGEHFTERIAFRIREMLPAKKRIAEGEPCRNAVFPKKSQYLLRLCLSCFHAAAAPQAPRRRPIHRTDVAPVIEIFPVLIKEREKYPVQLIEFEQPRKVKVRIHAFLVTRKVVSTITIIRMKKISRKTGMTAKVT